MWITLFRAILLLFCFFFFCIDTSLPPKTPIIKTEQWNLSEPATNNSADININTHQNGSLSCDGQWSFSLAGIDFKSKNLSGSVYKDTTYLSISCSGTACFSGNYEMENESEYELTFWGQFKGGYASGNWEISFEEPDWEYFSSKGRTFEGILMSEKSISQE